MRDLDALLAQMTLEEKVGQMAQYSGHLLIKTDAEITGPMAALKLSREDLGRIGSVLSFKNAAEVIEIQQQHLEADRNKIPLLFMLDVIHGYRTVYPLPIAMGASFDPKLAEECAAMAAREASASGVHVTFSPMVDHSRDARWGRVAESCGEDPLLNGIMGAAQVRGYRGNDLQSKESIAACVKHFAAYGGAEGGRDYDQAEISEHTLREQYLPAYKACLDAGADMVMAAFNVVGGVPAVCNRWLMNTVMREEWGAEPVVISDHSSIKELLNHGVAADYTQASELAFRAGCHIDMCSNAYMHELKTLVENGTICESEIDKLVLQILQLKDKLGLFEDPIRGASAEREAKTHLCPEHRAIVRRAANECAVLLKNNGILPISADVKKIALIGPFAEEQELLGYWYGYGRSDETVSVAEGLRKALPQAEIVCVKGCEARIGQPDNTDFTEAAAAAKQADIVILCLGDRQEYSCESNSRADIALVGTQNALAQAVIEANPNTAVVLFTGRPLAIPELDAIAPAILNMWFPGNEAGNAVADLLLGKANPCGKINMSFPKFVGQCPVYYNRTNSGRPKPVEKDGEYVRYTAGYLDHGSFALYPFGHGLSYSNFIYEDLTVSKESFTAEESVDIRITVYNDSDRAGKETVLLFMRDMVGSTARPVQQLIAFEKVEFAPYERKTVTFRVDEPMLRFWNWENKFVSEPGVFQFSTGCADRLILAKEATLM